jgi:hypothetical protein
MNARRAAQVGLHGLEAHAVLLAVSTPSNLSRGLYEPLTVTLNSRKTAGRGLKGACHNLEFFDTV